MPRCISGRRAMKWTGTAICTLLLAATASGVCGSYGYVSSKRLIISIVCGALTASWTDPPAAGAPDTRLRMLPIGPFFHAHQTWQDALDGFPVFAAVPKHNS